MSERYDFTDLSAAQRKALALGRWRVGGLWSEPSRRTADKLVERGLLVPVYRDRRVAEYVVPQEIRAAFLAYAALRYRKPLRVAAC